MAMAIIGLVEERLHNKAVLAYAKTFGQEYEIHINLGDDQEYSLQGYYPDIIAINKTTGKVNVAEVKTKTLIIPSQVICQWEPFSHLGDSFTLLIPKGYEMETLYLSHTVKVDKIITFYENTSGDIVFEDYIDQQELILGVENLSDK